jgi:hypothetical protein
VQVRGEGGIRVGAGIDGAVVIIILGDSDPLDSSKLLFQVTDNGLLLLSSKGGSMPARPGLIQGVLCATATAETRASCSQCVVATTV